MIASKRATIDDLRQVPDGGKAELVNGKIQLMSPTGGLPGRAGGKIYSSLSRHEEEIGGGFAIPDNVGFVVELPNRGSFSPDALAPASGAIVRLGALRRGSHLSSSKSR